MEINFASFFGDAKLWEYSRSPYDYEEWETYPVCSTPSHHKTETPMLALAIRTLPPPSFFCLFWGPKKC